MFFFILNSIKLIISIKNKWRRVIRLIMMRSLIRLCISLPAGILIMIMRIVCSFAMNNRIRGKSIVKTATSPKTSGRMNQNGISSALTAAATALLTAALAARRALIASRKSSAIRLLSSTYEATVTGSVGCSIPTI